MTDQVEASEVCCLYNPIMQSIQAKLDVVIQRNQIVGKEAAGLYLQALESTLQQVITLLLGADQRKLILAQTDKAKADTNKILHETENVILEGLNIPKEGALLDQQLIKLIADTELVPKQGQLIDAQILHLQHENDNLVAQLRILELQGDNLVKEGNNLDKQTELLTQQILALKEDVKGKAMDVKVKGTQAEHNRANAALAMAQSASIGAEQYAKILSVMVNAYNTSVSVTADMDVAFDVGAINSMASKAEGAIAYTTPYVFV